MNLTPTFVGDVVHYWPDGGDEPYAAFVTAVVNGTTGRVWLAVLLPGRSEVMPVAADFSDSPAAEHWTRRRSG